MGGSLIILSIFVSSIQWSDLNNRYVWVMIGAVICSIGWVDDYRKVVEKIRAACPGDGNIFAVRRGLVLPFFYTIGSKPCRSRVNCSIL